MPVTIHYPVKEGVGYCALKGFCYTLPRYASASAGASRGARCGWIPCSAQDDNQTDPRPDSAARTWRCEGITGEKCPQNKTSQTRLSPGTFVEQALPRKIVHKHPNNRGSGRLWPECATRKASVCEGLAGLRPSCGKLGILDITSPSRSSSRRCSLLPAVPESARPAVNCGKWRQWFASRAETQ